MALFWTERERDCVTLAPHLSPGARVWDMSAGARGTGPARARAQKCFRTSPPPPAPVDSLGDFHPLPQLCSSQTLQAPRAEPTLSLVARRGCSTGSAAEPRISPTTLPKSSANIDAGPLARRRGVP